MVVLAEVPLGRAVDLAVVEVPDKVQVVDGVTRPRGAALRTAPVEALDLGRHQRGFFSRGVFGELLIDPQLAGTGADGKGNDGENGDGEKVHADLCSQVPSDCGDCLLRRLKPLEAHDPKR